MLKAIKIMRFEGFIDLRMFVLGRLSVDKLSINVCFQEYMKVTEF
jgi:hypothetical protein